jgi:hypothetical protein
MFAPSNKDTAMKNYTCNKRYSGQYKVTCINGWVFHLSVWAGEWTCIFGEESTNRDKYDLSETTWFDKKSDALLWVNNRVRETLN